MPAGELPVLEMPVLEWLVQDSVNEAARRSPVIDT
jgi:hypothetical protein